MPRKRTFYNLKSRYCCEDISKIENYDKAIEDNLNGWVIHHRDEIRILPSGIKVIRTREELIEKIKECPFEIDFDKFQLENFFKFEKEDMKIVRYIKEHNYEDIQKLLTWKRIW